MLKRIKELDYHPNQADRREPPSRIFREQHFGLVISSSEQDPDLEKEEIQQMLARRLDVLLIASARGRVDRFRRIEAQQKQYILIDCRFEGQAAHFVGTDDLTAGRIATEHLVEQGCRRIAHLGRRDTSTEMARL